MKKTNAVYQDVGQGWIELPDGTRNNPATRFDFNFKRLCKRKRPWWFKLMGLKAI